MFTKSSLAVLLAVLVGVVAASQSPTTPSTPRSTPAAVQTVTLIGCVSAGTSPTTYRLTNAIQASAAVAPDRAEWSRTRAVLAAAASRLSGIDMRAYVGQRVRIVGQVTQYDIGSDATATELEAALMEFHVTSARPAGGSCS